MGCPSGCCPHSPVAIQAQLRHLSTLSTWKKKNQFAHELETVVIITRSLGTGWGMEGSIWVSGGSQ